MYNKDENSLYIFVYLIMFVFFLDVFLFSPVRPYPKKILKEFNNRKIIKCIDKNNFIELSKKNSYLKTFSNNNWFVFVDKNNSNKIIYKIKQNNFNKNCEIIK